MSINNENGINSIIDKNFIKYIINGMYDWVRVLDTNDTVIFVNEAMSKALGGNLLGNKCYKALKKDSPCENCISRKAVFEGTSHQKEEIIGGRIFSVMSSPIKDETGKVVACVEVLHDITDMKNLQQKIIEQNKKLQSDLNIARKLQCSLLPKQLFSSDFEFSYIYKPCETLGGDFLDIFKIDEDHTGIYIADVSGHGVAASMLTVFLRSSINKSTLSPAEALTSLYQDFNRDYKDQDLYITVFYAIVDVKNYSIDYSNAGHSVSPVLFNPSGKFELLRVPGIPISNWLEDPSYKNVTIKLEKDDRLFMYTDGIIELKDKNGEQYGEERLLNTLLSENTSPVVILDRIVEDASAFASIRTFNEISDDITMLLLEIK